MSFSVTLRETSPPYIVSRPHVILVEDDETQGWSMSRKIERHGADCTLIADLTEAEHAIPQLLSTEHPYRPTILLMDQQLPYNGVTETGVDGWTLMAEMLGQMHDGILHPAFLVAISADLYGENRDFYNEQIGAHACLEKPIHDYQVQELLEQVVTAVPLLPPPLPKKRPDEPVAQQRWSIGDMGRRALQGLRSLVSSKQQLPSLTTEEIMVLLRQPLHDPNRITIAERCGGEGRVREQLDAFHHQLLTSSVGEDRILASVLHTRLTRQSMSNLAETLGYHRSHLYNFEHILAARLSLWMNHHE